MKPTVKRVQAAAPFSRRFLLSAPSLLAAPLVAARQPPQSAIDQAREQAARNAEAISKVGVARSLEPAFRFEA